MSILHPETAEDKMAWVPFGCFVLLLTVAGLLAWWLVGALA